MLNVGNIIETNLYTTMFLKDKGPNFERCPRCLHCFPYINNGTSQMENDLINFCKIYFPKLQDHYYDLINPYEIDIYIKELNLAIEFNGSYYHSIEKKPLGYHLMKTIMCENLGIRLIHIWENEWNNNQAIIQQKLTNIFNNNEIIDYSQKLDRSWYGKFLVNGYELIEETKPEIIIRDKQQVENCGYLIYKKLEK